MLDLLVELEKSGQLDKAYFDDIPIEVYHHPLCPGVSSTTLKQVLNRTPEFKKSAAMDLGNAFHSLILEPEQFSTRYSIGQPAIDKTFISFSDYALILKMEEVLKSHPVAMSLLDGSVRERTFFSRDAETGLLKKCRTDSIKIDVIADLKTCENASESEFTYAAKKYGYGFSAAYYIEVVSEVLGLWINDFTLIAVDKKEEPKVGLYRPTQDCIAQKSMQVREALEIYKLNKTLSVKPFVGSSMEIKEVWL